MLQLIESFLVLLQDKAKLEAEVQALGSVVEGLKAERKLWGEELAQQGEFGKNTWVLQ